MNRDQMIYNCMHAVVPANYRKYPKHWYESLTDAQLWAMHRQIIVFEPTGYEEEMDPETMDTLAALEDEVMPTEEQMLKDLYPTFPYRLNESTGKMEVYTESHTWEETE